MKLKSVSMLLRPYSNGTCSVPSLLLGFGVLIAFGLGSCTSNSQTTDAERQDASELQVITTFLPITQFTQAVAGDRAQVTQLLPTNVGPHDYQATPEGTQQLAKADVLVKNGLEMESFLEKLIQNAGNADLQVIDTSEGIATISSEDIEGHGEGHGKNEGHADHADHADHDHETETSATAGTIETDEGHDGTHDHGAFNPHIWLDPKRAIQQVENIRDGLIAADPEGKSTYTANATAYINQLTALDQEITASLKPYQGKTFVAFHDFAPYFAESYGLEAEFLVDVPEENPTPGDVKRVMDIVQQSNLKTLLTEPQAGERVFTTIAQDLKVRVSLFDPMETGSEAALQPGYYFTTMRKNIDQLKSAFIGTRQSWVPNAIVHLPPQVKFPSAVIAR